MPENKWEHVSTGTVNLDITETTQRMKVFGGWIVRTITEYQDASIAMVFVPDAAHKWDVSVPENVKIQN